MPISHLAPEIALALGAVLILVATSFLRHDRQWLAAPGAVGTLLTAAWLAARLDARLPPQTTFSGTWALDGVTAWTTWTACLAAAVVAVLSPRWFRHDRRHGEWYALLLLSTLGTLLLAGAADAMEVMVAMLLVSVTGYTLASYHRASRMCAEAGAKYFFLGALTNPLLYLGIVLLYGYAATTRFEGIAAAQDSADPVVLTAAAALVLVGLAFEMGAFPVHAWVPDVTQASPGPAAAFLTVVPKLGALVAIARFVTILPDDAIGWRPAVAFMAASTMTLGNLAAVWQEDVRRLLGWSSVSQAGYGLMGVVALGRSSLAVPSLLLFLLAYALANVGALGTIVALRGRTRLEDFQGLSRARPWHAAALIVAMLSLTGIPPLVGFTAKLALFGASLDAGYGWLALLAAANTVVSLFYYLRVIGPMVLDTPSRPVATLGWESSAVAIATAIATLGAGLLAGPLLELAAAAALLPQRTFGNSAPVP